jgi:hypothetical protein
VIAIGVIAAVCGHAISSNASNTEPAKVLVVAVHEIDKPLTVPEKP